MFKCRAGVLHRDAGSIPLAIEAYERSLLIDPDSRNAGQVKMLLPRRLPFSSTLSCCVCSPVVFLLMALTLLLAISGISESPSGNELHLRG